MSHVFVSYKREDEVRVGRITRALEAAGMTVWWDRGLPGGESWHANIEANLGAAGCVIVVWSHGSVGPEGRYVRDEARRGLARGVLVPVLIDPVEAIPLGFGEAQAIDLAHWKGDPRDPFFQDLLATVRAKLEGAPAPRPSGPTARIGRRLLYGGVSGAGLLALAALALNAFGSAGTLCSLPGPQPGLSDACGAVGMGGRPSRAERLAWEKIPAGSCVALREHIARFPAGAYRREAADFLTARTVTVAEAWSPVIRPLAEVVEADGPPAPGLHAARRLALGRGQAQASRLCQGFSAGTLFRLVAASARPASWSCSTTGGGIVCGFEGDAACALLQRGEVERERCGPK